MAGEVTSKGFFFFLLLLLWFISAHCSGTLVGFSFDARGERAATEQAVSLFLKSNMVSPSQIRVSVSAQNTLFSDSSLFNTGLPVDLYLNSHETQELVKSKSSATSWLQTHVSDILPLINITSVTVSGLLPSLLPTLNFIHSALKTLGLNGRIELSAEFPLTLQLPHSIHEKKSLESIMSFLRRTATSVTVEVQIDGELSFGEHLVRSVIRSAVTSCGLFPYPDLRIILNVKSSVAPSDVEVAGFTEKLLNSMGGHPQIKHRVRKLFVEITPRELGREEEQIFPSSRRELLTSAIDKVTLHEFVTPITNPVTTPGIITVPSTNPVTVLPTNPASPAVTIPSTIPLPTTNPVTTPITVPSTIPMIPPPASVVPITNPVTTYPFPPPSNVPMTPGVAAPAVAGQVWCVAKMGVPDAALQIALDYACGFGGADCSTIQQTGSCFNPNTVRDHASYAFNSYYQRNPSPTSCDFGGTAMLVSNNPSTTTCIYPSSSSAPSIVNTTPPAGVNTPPPAGVNTAPPAVVNTPPPAGVSITPPVITNSPPAGVNTNNPAGLTSSNPTGGSSNVFGSNNPIGSGSNNPIGSVNPTSSTSNSCLSAGLPLLFALTSASLYTIRDIRWAM